MKSVMECEKSVMVMTLLWHDYLVSGFCNCVDDTPTETGLRVQLCRHDKMNYTLRAAQ